MFGTTGATRTRVKKSKILCGFPDLVQGTSIFFVLNDKEQGSHLCTLYGLQTDTLELFTALMGKRFRWIDRKLSGNGDTPDDGCITVFVL
jgi:hypothetical protein